MEDTAVGRPAPKEDADFDALFAEEYPKVLRTTALLLDDVEAAADVTQDAFVALHLHWAKVGRYERPGAWVRRVAVRDAVRLLRKRSKQDLRAVVDETDERAELRVEHLDVRAAVTSLPGGQRAAIVLHYLEDLAVHEVSLVLGCSEATTRVHLHRGRRRLAHLLGEEAR